MPEAADAHAVTILAEQRLEERQGVDEVVDDEHVTGRRDPTRPRVLGRSSATLTRRLASAARAATARDGDLADAGSSGASGDDRRSTPARPGGLRRPSRWPPTASVRGNVRVKAEPWFSRELTSMSPPSARASRRESASPTPVPAKRRPSPA